MRRRIPWTIFGYDDMTPPRFVSLCILVGIVCVGLSPCYSIPTIGLDALSLGVALAEPRGDRGEI